MKMNPLPVLDGTSLAESHSYNRRFLGNLRADRRGIHPFSKKRVWCWIVITLGFSLLYDTGIVENGFLSDVVAADASGEHSSTGGEHAGGEESPVTPVLVAIILVLFAAKTGGDILERMGMPAVLGELAVGVVLGNLDLTGFEVFDQYFKIPPDAATGGLYNPAEVIKIFADIGVILLLFEVGLETTVKQMMSVGKTAFIVAVMGVIVPIVLGYGAGHFLFHRDPATDWMVHLFLGATLCATSVGITARVLKDLGRHRQKESQIILGAAVIDDVLGLIVLAVVAGLVKKGDVNTIEVLKIVAYAFAFLAGAIFLGTRLFARPLLLAASYLRGHGLLVATALIICFGFSWLASLLGLATIVGAFAAGLILEGAHYQELGKREHHNLEEALAPLSALFVPIFFVQMGTQVNLRAFSNPDVWLLAGSLTVVAILGKQVCAWGVREKGLNRLAVGLGMIPRGEVGLIFAAMGKELTVVIDGKKVHLFNDASFSAIIVMVMITTMVTPPLLKWALERKQSEQDGVTPPE